MTTEILESGLVAFRPRARLLKLIGAELISDDVLAITELVKNAHDADAATVTISFRDVTGPAGEIVVRDDGTGMDLETVLGRWMEPAGSSKLGQERRLTPRGRRALGEKGVGRFAADKLARHLELVSRPAGADREVRAVFDWDEFDTDARLLSDVRSRWELRPAGEIRTHGTILRMSNLRSAWNERMFRRLCTRLSRLRSPFRAQDSFSIRIESDEFPEYAGELRSDFLDRAPYQIDASFDGDQTIDIKLNGKSTSLPWNGTGELRCGPVRVRLFAFDLETEALARIGPRLEVRGWLKEWSGISIYRDGFRVWPYGEPHDDWLRLDQRRVNNPVVRLSNNQVVGFVEISRDANAELTDQTNREGLIHNGAFEDLRRLMYFVLQTIEAERQALRHPTQRKRAGEVRVVTPADSVPRSLEVLAGRASGELAQAIRKLATQARESAERAEERQRRMLEGYSDLAAAGQSAVGVSRSVMPMIEELRRQCNALRSTLGRKADPEVARKLRELEHAMESMGGRIAMLVPPEDAPGQRRRALDVPAEVEAFGEMMAPVLEEQGVRLTTELPRRGVVRVEMRPESLHRLLYILASNSLDWLRRRSDPEIRIVVTPLEELCEILFSDNGPGISQELAERVFEPMFSGKEGGRGMGLTIARNMVVQHGGTISVLNDRRRKGANILVLLPRKRSRATVHAH